MSADKTDGPLIPESLVLFYRRMAKEFKEPALPDAVAIAHLSRVVELHHCAATVIQAALDLSESSGRLQLEELCGKETQLACSVGELVTEMGGSPPRQEESSLELPHDARAMSGARNQDELLRWVGEDLDYVAQAHLELTSAEEIPAEMHGPLKALLSRD